MDYWESTVYAEPPLSTLPRNDQTATFGWLRGALPAAGTKIDWSRAWYPHRHLAATSDADLSAAAVREICRLLAAGGSVTHAGDSLSPFAVTFDATGAESIVLALLQIPEHHYFVAQDRSWVVVVTSEGDLDVVDLSAGAVLVLDGNAFDDFPGFAREFSTLLRDYEWRGSLDAFDDILHGGFGTPDRRWTLRWVNSERSRSVLGYPATVRWLEERLPKVHPANRSRVQAELEQARRGVEQTLFESIVDIIGTHAFIASEREDGITLELL